MMSRFCHQVSVATAQRLLSFLHCFHSTQVNASCPLLICLDIAVCRTVCSSTQVQIQMGILLCYLVSTANPHCVQGPLQFYSTLVCCSTMLLMSVSTQSHLQCFVLHSLTIFLLLLVVVHFQDDQQFSPTTSLLCKFISGTTHLNFILQNSWHTVARSGKK